MIVAVLAALSVFLAVHGGLLWREEIRQRSLFLRLTGRESAPSWKARAIERYRRRSRGLEALRTLPDFLELAAMGLSAGLVLEAAWAAALAGLSSGPVRQELGRALELARRGGSKGEAFREAGRRLGEPRVAMVLALVAQSLERGNDAGEVLLDQAAALRAAALAQMERRSQTAPLRLLLPILFFLLPAVFLILLGPVFVRAVHGLPLF